MQIDTLLQAVKDGKMNIQEAKELLARAPYEELGFAKLDSHRTVRTGFAEVVYCENKADDFLVEIFSRLFSANGEVMGTRCSEKQYQLLKKRLPELTYDPISRIAKIEKPKKEQGLLPSVRREQLILPSQKNAHKLRNFSDKTLNVSTISVLAASTDYFLRSIVCRRPTASWQLQAWKGPWPPLLADL